MFNNKYGNIMFIIAIENDILIFCLFYANFILFVNNIIY